MSEDAGRNGDEVPDGAVIACVDGTERDGPVLAWAAEGADRRGHPLHILNARESLSSMGLPGDPSFAPSRVTLEQLDAVDGSDEIVTSAAHRAREVHPGLGVTTSRPWGTAVQSILAAAEHATVVVVGGGRKSAMARLFLGSTALSVTAHAACPVVVIGPDGVPDPPRRRIVVGVDGSQDSDAALDFALDASLSREAELVLLMAWNVEVVDGYVVTTPGTDAWNDVERRCREAVEQQLGRRRQDRHRDLPVSVEVVHGGRVESLCDRSASADLVVVGSRGRGGFTGMLLGSVTQEVLHAATCPVGVITHRS